MDSALPPLYPLRTDPAFQHYIWGGSKLGTLLGKPLGPDRTLAESWEVADEARVAEGAWKGRTLREVDEVTGGALTGDAPHYAHARLPILIKLSHSAKDLSVQIHPNDEHALRDAPERGYPGKTEMYVILDADPGAGVYWGIREGVSAEQLNQAARSGEGVRELINFVPVKAGDVLFSPSGVVHAIGKGIMYCEVQQNSDITYRLYDWGRVDASGKRRPLHLEQGMAVLDISKQRAEAIQPLLLPGSPAGMRRSMLCACRHFAVELLEFDGVAPASGVVTVPHVPAIGDILSEAGIHASFDLRRARRTMRALVVLDGVVSVAAGPHVTHCEKGQSVVVPAAMPESAVGANGRARVLLTYEPDLAADVVDPLRAAGYTADEVASLGDIR